MKPSVALFFFFVSVVAAAVSSPDPGAGGGAASAAASFASAAAEASTTRARAGAILVREGADGGCGTKADDGPAIAASSSSGTERWDHGQDSMLGRYEATKRERERAEVGNGLQVAWLDRSCAWQVEFVSSLRRPSEGADAARKDRSKQDTCTAQQVDLSGNHGATSGCNGAIRSHIYRGLCVHHNIYIPIWIKL